MLHTKTLELDTLILRALAVGIDRLNDGDSDDCQDAHEVEKVLARAGYVVSCGQCFDAKEATSGYVKGEGSEGVYTFVNGKGAWTPAVEPGTTLFLDRDCTVPVRTVENPNEYVSDGQS